ncbi:hypothetical protein M0R72_07700 [Candidatus Pacearchaeota archaeon]|nr:hypothetical protein [Candidatus Pacearchaeota archaeon]
MTYQILEKTIQQSRKLRLKCKHKWCRTSYVGHGKWRLGCSKCGALGR